MRNQRSSQAFSCISGTRPDVVTRTYNVKKASQIKIAILHRENRFYSRVQLLRMHSWLQAMRGTSSLSSMIYIWRDLGLGGFAYWAIPPIPPLYPLPDNILFLILIRICVWGDWFDEMKKRASWHIDGFFQTPHPSPCVSRLYFLGRARL